MASAEIHSIQSISGNQPRMRRLIEESGQTFLPGTPVSIASGDGGVQAWNGSTIAYGIAGFSKEFAHNLGSTGSIPIASNPGPQPGSAIVPNETSALSITRPFFQDGRIGFEVADPDTVFLAQVGPSQSVTNANVGIQYGMTKDSDNHWYVDTTKTTVGTNTVCTIVRLDPNDQSASPRGVYIIINPGNAQLIG